MRKIKGANNGSWKNKGGAEKKNGNTVAEKRKKCGKKIRKRRECGKQGVRKKVWKKGREGCGEKKRAV